MRIPAMRLLVGWLVVGWLVFNGTFSTNRPYLAVKVLNILCKAGGKYETKQHNNTLNRTTHRTALPSGLCGDKLLDSNVRLQRSLCSQSLGKYSSTDNYTKTTRTNTQQTKL